MALQRRTCAGITDYTGANGYFFSLMDFQLQWLLRTNHILLFYVMTVVDQWELRIHEKYEREISDRF